MTLKSPTFLLLKLQFIFYILYQNLNILYFVYLNIYNYFIFNELIYFSLQLQFPLPSLITVPPSHLISVPTSQSTVPPPLSWKGHVSCEYQQNMAHQVAARLSTSP